MAASRYRKFLRLVEQWPVDPTKEGRDLGAFLRQQVAFSFKQGENTVVDERECDRIYENLHKISTDHYRNKYPRLKESSASGGTLEECSTMMATVVIEELEDIFEKPMRQKIKDFFFRNSQTDSKS